MIDQTEGYIVKTSVNNIDDENTPLLSNNCGCLQVHALKITSSQLQVPFCPWLLWMCVWNRHQHTLSDVWFHVLFVCKTVSKCVHNIYIHDNTTTHLRQKTLAPVAVYRTVSHIPQDRPLSLSNSRAFTSTVLVARSDNVSWSSNESQRLTRRAYTHSISFRSNRRQNQECSLFLPMGIGFKWKHLLESASRMSVTEMWFFSPGLCQWFHA